MKARPYQIKAVEGIYNAIKNKKRHPLLYLITGGGKTFIAEMIIQRALQKNRKILFIVRRKHLCFQTYKRFINKFRIHTISLLMSGYDSEWKSYADIYVASVDTLYRRLDKKGNLLFSECDLIFIDEAHDATSNTYKKILEFFKNKFIIGMTATPFYIGSFKAHTFWDSVVQPITATEMQDKGYLCSMDFYTPPTRILYEKLTVAQGEYTSSSVFKEVNKKELYGDFIKYFKEYGFGRKTITFCMNIKHAIEIEKILKQNFNLENIIRIDSDLEEKEQFFLKRNLDNYIEKDLSFHIINVNMFSTGIDIPSLEVGFMIRPTKSLVLWYQQLGRLMRICEGKTKATVIDFTKNTLTLGNPFIFNKHPDLSINLQNKKIENVKKIKLCLNCYKYVDINSKICNNCGQSFTNKNSKAYKEIDFNESIKLVKLKDFKKIKEKILKDLKEKSLKNNIKHTSRETLNGIKNKDWKELYEKYGDDLFELNLIPNKSKKFLKRRSKINLNIDNLKILI